MDLPPYVDWDTVQKRLAQIFPKGTPNRNYCVREIAASTVFTMLYAGAIEGLGRFIGPKHVCRMDDEQSAEATSEARYAYLRDCLKPGFRPRGQPWYADNTREPIRDETLREGLLPLGAAIAHKDLPTTSSSPRYALSAGFATLFDPGLTAEAFEQVAGHWRETHLNPSELARIEILRRGASASANRIKVLLPSGEVRQLSSGLSSEITKRVIESFAPSFLKEPAVIWVSESETKVNPLDDALAKKIGLRLRADQNLPDIIMADIGTRPTLLVFVEVVATDGAITPRRKKELLKIAVSGGFDEDQVVFLTAYRDRSAAAFRKTIGEVAWRSFVWFTTEPDKIVFFGGVLGHQGLAGLLRPG